MSCSNLQLGLYTISEPRGGRLGQWLGHRILDNGVPGSSPGRVPFVLALSKSYLPPA